MRFTRLFKRPNQAKENRAPKTYVNAVVLLVACSALAGVVTPLAVHLGLPSMASLLSSLWHRHDSQKADNSLESEDSADPSAAAPESEETASASGEETDEDSDRTWSKKVFRRGDLVLKPHPKEFGIDALSVYRRKKLILHKSIHYDFMWLAFPFEGKSAEVAHTFDGGRCDYISESANPASTPFTDFDGDSVPDLIVVQSYGNAGNMYTIYSLGKRAKRLARLETVRSDAVFMDIDHDGRCEALAHDSAFFGWETCNAESAMPQVILKMRHKRFQLATGLMRSEPPSKARQEAILADWSNACRAEYANLGQAHLVEKYDKKTFYMAPAVWRDMLDLIYSGNSKMAFSLLDRFWHKGTCAGNLEYEENCPVVHTSKKEFRQMFLEQLRCSEYLDGIKQLNQGDARIRNLGPSLHTDSGWTDQT